MITKIEFQQLKEMMNLMPTIDQLNSEDALFDGYCMPSIRSHVISCIVLNLQLILCDVYNKIHKHIRCFGEL